MIANCCFTIRQLITSREFRKFPEYVIELENWIGMKCWCFIIGSVGIRNYLFSQYVWKFCRKWEIFAGKFHSNKAGLIWNGDKELLKLNPYNLLFNCRYILKIIYKITLPFHLQLKWIENIENMFNFQ